jgi:hypothetical protein
MYSPTEKCISILQTLKCIRTEGTHPVQIFFIIFLDDLFRTQYMKMQNFSNITVIWDLTPTTVAYKHTGVF